MPLGKELPPKLIETHQAYFRFFESRKVEQIPELLFILTMGIGVRGDYDAQSGIREDLGNVVGRSLSRRSQFHHKLPAYLIDFGRRNLS